VCTPEVRAGKPALATAPPGATADQPVRAIGPITAETGSCHPAGPLEDRFPEVPRCGGLLRRAGQVILRICRPPVTHQWVGDCIAAYYGAVHTCSTMWPKQ